MSYLYMERSFTRKEIKYYIIARIARVLPLFFILILGSYLLYQFDIPGVLYKIPTESSLFSHLTFLLGESVLWTIPAEIQFYLLFIFFWWLFSQRPGYVYTLFAVIFIVLVFLNFPRMRGDVQGIYYDIHLFYTLPYFLIGVVFGRLYAQWRPPEYLIKHVFALSLGLLFLLYPDIFFWLTGYKHGLWNDVGVHFTLAFIFFCVVFLVPDNNFLLSNRIGDFLGKISYSIYLLHMPVIWFLNRFKGLETEWFVALFLILTLFVSTLSYTFIERPAGQWVRSLGKKA